MEVSFRYLRMKIGRILGGWTSKKKLLIRLKEIDYVRRKTRSFVGKYG